jgi:hypothetical protein
MRFLRWLFGGADEVPREVRAARWAAIRQEMDEHPAHRGESVGRMEARRIGDRLHFWRKAWRDRESGG